MTHATTGPTNAAVEKTTPNHRRRPSRNPPTQQARISHNLLEHPFFPFSGRAIEDQRSSIRLSSLRSASLLGSATEGAVMDDGEGGGDDSVTFEEAEDGEGEEEGEEGDEAPQLGQEPFGDLHCRLQSAEQREREREIREEDGDDEREIAEELFFGGV